MSKLFSLLDEIRNKINETLRDNTSLILTIDISIHQGEVRGCKIYKKNKI